MRGSGTDYLALAVIECEAEGLGIILVTPDVGDHRIHSPTNPDIVQVSKNKF